MKVSSYIAMAVIAASSSLGLSTAQAQSISSVQAPAEFPPSSYTGRQYVDSDGCVFVRAGIDGNVSWVPRVARNRKVICGFQPSLPSAARVVEAPVQPAAEPVAKPAARAPAAAAPVAKPKPVTVARQPAPKPVVVPQPRTVRAPVTVQPTVVATPRTVKVAKAPAPKVTKTVKAAPRQSTCRGASAISSRYLTAASGLSVRCGPQATSHVTIVNGGQGHRTKMAPVPSYTQTYTQPAPLKRSTSYATSTVTAAPTRVVRQNVYDNQVASTLGVYIPEGYKPAWTDDRLNTRRAYETYAGRSQMELVWTNTVPRRLVERKSGREVAYMYPGLQYPHLSYAQQEQAQATLSTRGATAQVKRPVEAANPAAQRRAERKQQKALATTTKPNRAAVTNRATISTRSTVRQAQPATASHRYVQAGMFADQGNAQRAAQRIANSGLPAKLGKATRNGRTYGVVVAGPFQSQSQLNAALQRVRSMGFGDAFLRK